MLLLLWGESLSVLSTQGNSFALPSDMYESFPNFDFHHFLVEFPYAPLKTLKTSASSFIILNLVNKCVLHFLITNGLSTDFSTTESIDRIFSRTLLKNHEILN